MIIIIIVVIIITMIAIIIIIIIIIIFEIEKCNLLILKGGIKDENYDMLPNDLKIFSLKEGENYKYLGILEVEDINIKKMKEKVKAEYLRHTRKVLESKLDGGNLFKAINTWTMSFLFCCIYRLDKGGNIRNRYKNS